MLPPDYESSKRRPDPSKRKPALNPRRDRSHRLRGLELLETRMVLSVLTVTDTSDSASDPGSLRSAINAINASGSSAVPNTIDFNIPGSGIQTIDVSIALPALTKPTLIDGTSQPGHVSSPLIEINGGSSGNAAYGLELDSGSDGSTILGLVIDAFGSGTGIVIQSNNDSVQSCYVGLTPAGTAASSNRYGLLINTGVTGTTIGGTTTGEGNVISANTNDGLKIYGTGTTGNLVVGNDFGTDSTGTTALSGFDNAGIDLVSGATGNTIGGTTPGARNIISGNHNGLAIGNAATGGNVVEGNYIGTDVTGTVAVPNDYGIASLATSGGNTIGGSVAGAGNLVSGNNIHGIDIENESADVVQGNVIGLSTASTPTALPNGTDGIFVQSDQNVIIGGLTSFGTNVISGNGNDGIEISGSTGTLVEGNLIGTDATGTVAVGNVNGVKLDGIALNNTVGGSVAGAGNLISGNPNAGVLLNGSGVSDNLVEGNFIGTDVTGLVALPNMLGVDLESTGGGNTIGGATSNPGFFAGNLIAGNQYGINANAEPGANPDFILGNLIGVGIISGANSSPGNSFDGIYLQSDSGIQIGGLTTGDGNVISGNVDVGLDLYNSSSALVEGNWIGTNAAGTSAVANSNGVEINQGSTNNTIGGTVAGARNIISGNSNNGVWIFDLGTSGNVVEGDYIGTDATGLIALANVNDGVMIESGASDNTIGGTVAAALNVISGNASVGVEIQSTGTMANVIEGDFIGLNASGTAALANTSDGVYIGGGATGNTIGGSVAGARDIISGNDVHGIYLDSPSNFVQGDYIGTDVTGLLPVGNSVHGIFGDAANETIGGPSSLPGAAPGNVIAGNAGIGIFLTTTTGTQVVEGNIIGLGSDGSTVIGNNYGIYLVNAPGVTVGGTAAGDRNVISGNIDYGVAIGGSSPNTYVEGNDIGTDITGELNRGNTIVGIDISSTGVVIGGVTSTPGSGLGNLISGNGTAGSGGSGILTSANGTLIEGNIIGPDAAGQTSLGVQSDGVEIVGASTDEVGGTVAGAGNLISGNTYGGVVLGAVGAGYAGASADYVQGNLIGTNLAGTSAVANGSGVIIDDGTGITIGGTVTGDRNVISGNSAYGVNITSGTAIGNVVEGNLVGTDVTGTSAIANPTGIALTTGSTNTTIGGSVAGAGNVISGNSQYGVQINQSSGIVEANLIGTNLAGTTAIPNPTGVYVIQGSGVTIGGTTTLTSNLISGNGSMGLKIFASATTLVEGNLIGTNLTGTSALSNGFGIQLTGNSGTTIGGTVAGASNLISGNSSYGINPVAETGALIEGNLIGTNLSGSAAVGNGYGILINGRSTNITIGGTTAAARNVVSGNFDNGIQLQDVGTTDILIEGNDIGTGVTGTGALGNFNGILVYDSVGGNTIGGATSTPGTGAGNLIAGNTGDGINENGATGSDFIFGNLVGGIYLSPIIGASSPNAAGILVSGSSAIQIGGPSSLDENVISGNTNNGITIDSSTGSLIEGNLIGTNIAGTLGDGNRYGVVIQYGSNSNTIGGINAVDRNVISANSQHGIDLLQGVTNNVIEGNYVGTDVTGTVNLSNPEGIVLFATVGGNTIGGATSTPGAGAGNLIASSYIGLWINGGTGADVIEGNLIGSGSVAGGGTSLGNTYGIQVDYDTAIQIGGPSALDVNVISGNTNAGIDLYDTSGTLVEGNLIGTDNTGTVADPNLNGIEITNGSSNNTIGGSSALARNIISGNTQSGVAIDSSSGNYVEGDYIGTNQSGTAGLGNLGAGIEINAGSNNTIGETTTGASNVIEDNSGDGVQILSGLGNSIRGNSIFNNGGLGIELGTGGVPSTNILGGSTSGPNNSENHPILTLINYVSGTGTTVAGNINTTPDTKVFIDFYSDSLEDPTGYGQGQTYLGSLTVTTNGSGNASFSYVNVLVAAHSIVSATETTAAGNTSEFASDVAEDNPPIVSFVARSTTGTTTSPATTFNEGVPIYFDASASYSPDGDALSYTWQFGDGSTLVTSTPFANHVYHADGTYVPTLIVNDGYGGIESNIDILKINKVAPTITLNPLPTLIVVGSTLTLRGSINDPTADLETVVLTWGDGSSSTTLHLVAGTTTFSATHNYSSPLAGGSTTAGLTATVTDASNPSLAPPTVPLVPLTPTPTFDVGGLSGTTSGSVGVYQQNPSFANLTLSQGTVAVNGLITLSGQVVDPNGLVSHTITVQWGDIASGSTIFVLPPGVLNFSTSHVYLSTPSNALSGTYPISLGVVNSNQLSGSSATSVTVVDINPTVQIQTLSSSTTGSNVALVAVVTDPSTLSLITYQWLATQNGVAYASGTGKDFTFTAPSGGVFITSVVVTDQDGATAQASTQVIIGPSAPSNTVVFNPSGTSQVTITSDGTTSTPFTPGSSIIYYARGAQNMIDASAISLPVELVGSPSGTDTLIAGSGDDTLVSLMGQDSLVGTSGATVFRLLLATADSATVGLDPTLVGSTGINTIDLSGTTQTVTLNLGSTTLQTVDPGGDTVLLKGTFENVIAGSGNDILYAATGVNSSINGGSGNDLLYAGSMGNDSIVGGSGNATVVGGGGNDIIYGGTAGNDSIVGGSGNATIIGGGGNDIIYGGTAGNDSIVGGSGNATVVGSGGNDIIYGGTAGNDSIVGGGGNATIVGGGGNDIIYGGTTGNDSIVGGSGNATIVGGGGNDIIYGGTAGNDSIVGGSGNATVVGGGGNDIIYGGTAGNDSIVGGSGNATVVGGGGNDIIYGGTTGNDSIVGGSGNATVVGGGGNDIIYAGSMGNDSIVGGSGNATVVGGGGNDIIYAGSTGNDSIVGGSGDATMVGGSGNDIIYAGSMGNDSIVGGSGNATVVGGGGNDIIYAGSMGNDSIVGGSGNATVVGGGGNDIIYGGTAGNDSIVGGSGNATIVGGGGNDIIYGGTAGNDSIVGGSGNATIVGGGGNDIIYAGSTGNDSIVGGSGSATIVGGGGNDIIYAGSAGNDSIVGGSGSATIVGGGGNDIIYAGSTGNDSIVGGSGSTTIVGGGGNDIIYGGLTGDETIVGGSGPSLIYGGGGRDLINGGLGNDLIYGGSGLNTISGGGGNDIIYGGSNNWLVETDPLSSGTTPVTVTLTNTTLSMPGFGSETFSGISNVMVGLGSGNFVLDAHQDSSPLVLVAGTGDDTILAGTGNDVIYAGSGIDSMVGGGGNDTYVFGPDAAGNVTISDGSTTNNTLDFSLFSAGINLDLEAVGPQAVSPGALTLTLTNPSSIDQVLGTSYPDTILGNGRNDTLIGNGGADDLNARGGAALIEGYETQVVYLNFLLPSDPGYVPGDVNYSLQSTRDAIEARISAIYADFNFTFTQTQPTSGPYETLNFDIPAGSYLGGEATDLDWRNLSLGGSASVDISQFLGGPNEPANNLTDIINMSATIGAHELGHLSGLIHGNSFGPIGAGIYVNLANNLYLDGYLPSYTGPTGAGETRYHVMGSPDSVGTTLFDAATVTYFGEREAIAMAFADSGTTVNETTGPAGLNTNTSVSTAQSLPMSPLVVPNTLLFGQNLGDTFNVTAADVVGTVQLGANGQSNADYYAINATQGELLNFQVYAASITRDASRYIDSEITIYEADGKTIVPYNGSPGGATNDDGFQDADAVILDLTMPYTGVYYIKVSTYAVTDSFGILHNSDIGSYELFTYSFAATPASSTLANPTIDGDTLVGGSGHDTIIGSSANDLIEIVPGDLIENGSGVNTVDMLPYNLTITGISTDSAKTPITLNAGFMEANPGMNDTYLWQVVSSNGQVISSEQGQAVAMTELSSVSSTDESASFGFTPNASGIYTIMLTITDRYGGSSSTSFTETVGSGTPLVAQIGTGSSQVAGSQGSPVALAATPVGSQTLPIATYAWSVTVPGSATAPSPGSASTYSFTPTVAGTYVVTLMEIDAQGDVAITSTSIVVAAVVPSVQILGLPSNLFEAEGEAFSLSSLVINPLATPGLTESWTVSSNNGSQSTVTASGSSVSDTPDDTGTYTVTLNLVDASGQVVATTSTQIISIGVAPSATITGGPTAGTVNEGTSITFDGLGSSVSSVTESKGFYYTWGVTLNGLAYNVDQIPDNTQNYTFTPYQSGTYIVSLVVDDYHGFSSVTETETVVVKAVVPSVAITGAPAGNSTTIGSILSLGSTAGNPSSIIQSNGYSEAWSVQFDGATYGPYYGSNVNLTAASLGTYVVTLTATDVEGISGSASETIVVNDMAPIVTAPSSPTSANPKQATLTTFNLGSVTGAGLNGGTSTVVVNWGDGTPLSTFNINAQGDLGSLSHLYDLPGIYSVAVSVTDAYGLAGSATFSTTVTPVAASAAILNAPSSINAGNPISLGSSITDPSETETSFGYTYAWSVTFNGGSFTLPTGTAVNAPTFSFTPQGGGTYAVELAVSDHSGTVGLAPVQTILVNNVAPVATISGGATNVPVDTAITLNASATDPNMVATTSDFTYQWIVTGPNNTTVNGTGSSFTYTPSSVGTYTVGLIATNILNNLLSAEVTITETILIGTPTITWTQPSSIVYGTVLSSTQLDATASVAGTFTYSPALGTLLASGTDTLSVTFTPTDTTDYVSGVSDTVSLTVNKFTPILTLTGQTATYNAEAHPASFVITGANGESLTNLVGLTYNGTSTVPVNAGTYAVVATFGGNANDNAVPNATATVIINATPTTTSLTSSAAVAVPGQTVTFNAVVAPVSPGGGVPVGSVQFKNGSTILATVPLNGAGQASFLTSSLPGGNLTITAFYINSDLNSKNSISTGLAQTILSTGVTVSGTTLYVIGSNAADFALITPVGTSITGSTGIAYSATLNNSFSTATLKQTLTSIIIDGYSGNDNFQVASTIILPVILTDGNGNNYLQTGGGNDVITLGTGSNQVFGGGGNKTIIDQDAAGTSSYISLGTGNDSISLGAGNDQVRLAGGVSTVTGGNGNDTVINGLGGACIVLGNGNDYINTNVGTDAISLGNGNETIVIAGGIGLVTTGNGNNFISDGSLATGTLDLTMGNGNDTVSLSSGTYTVNLGGGNDYVAAVAGNTTVTAGSGNDTVQLGNGTNNVTLGNGNDYISSGTGGATINAGNGNDTVQLGSVAGVVDSIMLGSGNDYVSSGNANVNVTVGGGNDTTQLGNGTNVIVEGDGNDYVSSGNGANLVVGGLGKHTIQLGNGNNILIDGAATVVNQGDSLAQILSDWNRTSSALVNTRLKVTYNSTRPNYLSSGTGRDWFFYTDSKTNSNKKSTDRLN